MKPSRRARRARLTGLFATLLMLLGHGGNAAAQAVPTMTIKIYNDSDAYNIYPVLSTGTSTPDQWMQAAFGVPRSELGNNPYPKTNQFRLYINGLNGIPPGSSVTITVPLYSQLVPTDQVNPKLPDQYIDWWGGGRIYIYERAAIDQQPPDALVADYNHNKSMTGNPLTPIAGAALPICTEGCQTPAMEIFKDPDALPSNDPNQLIEYTLGAIKLAKDPYQIDLHNVDYDVSYVDNAYLPAAMEPYNNLQVGYIGTTQLIDTFKDALNRFLAAPIGAGWPQFSDNENETILKIPSALHIFPSLLTPGVPPPDLTPPPPWVPIEKMKELWRTCVTGGGTAPICDDIRDVQALFMANYQNYQSNYATRTEWSCNKAKQPVPLTEPLMLAHVYGWSPFNEQCTSSDANLLQDTPGYSENNNSKYQTVKTEFDKLQYWPTGEFDPYVILIHGKDYVNAPNVYAYSVDDAVGNMQVAGDGLIITVGGSGGLPNPDPATPPIHINFGYSPKDAIRFVQYGICTKTPDQDVDPDYASFDISTNHLSSCPLSLIDNQGQLYTFKITQQPPYPSTNYLTPETHAMIDCSGNTDDKSKNWCSNIFGYTVTVVNKSESYVIAPAPTQPPRRLRRR